MACTGLLRLLADWVLMYTFKESENITIEWRDNAGGSLEDAVGPFMFRELDRLLEKGIIVWQDDMVAVPDREGLLVYAESGNSEQNGV